MLFSSPELNIVASFLFIFALVYALLAHARLFRESRGASVVISIVIAFFAALYAPLTDFLIGILPVASVFLVVLFLFVFVRRVLFGEEKLVDAAPIAVGLAISLLLLGAFWNSVAPLLPMPLSPGNMLWILGILLIVLLFYSVHRHFAGKK